jgi:arginine utilization protein RocB
MKKTRSERIKKLALDLVRVQSDTGTRQEKDVENFLHAWLGKLDYFKSRPDCFGQYPLEQDPLGRRVVWGLVKGQGDQTVILMHHHDVVDSFDYGKLEKWAYDPINLERALKDVALSPEVSRELSNGQWLFGRGTGDMKGGAAIQLALLEEYAARPDLKGNILLLSVPDEESLSVGMRGSLSLLTELKERFKLSYKILINSGPHGKAQDKEGTLQIGSAGKLLPIVYVRGKKTHIGHIYQGFNPVLLLSEIVLQTELNTDYSDLIRGELSPPPSWSFMRDRKEVYDASIPLYAGGYLSLISLKKAPGELIAQLKATCENAFRQVIDKIKDSHAAYCRKKDAREPLFPWQVIVKTFEELYRQALADSGEDFKKAYAEQLESMAEEINQQRLNSPEATFRIIETTLSYVDDLSPMVVIALSPPYYPAIHNDDFPMLPESVGNLTDHLVRFAASRWQESYSITNYMMGLTDCSYAALQNSENIVPVIGPNMPLWQKTYDVPFAEMEALSLPIINIGPWGKDHHKFTERVFKPDLYERTPALLECAIEFLLKEE